jgi:hypothetical protein
MIFHITVIKTERTVIMKELKLKENSCLDFKESCANTKCNSVAELLALNWEAENNCVMRWFGSCCYSSFCYILERCIVMKQMIRFMYLFNIFLYRQYRFSEKQ